MPWRSRTAPLTTPARSSLATSSSAAWRASPVSVTSVTLRTATDAGCDGTPRSPRTAPKDFFLLVNHFEGPKAGEPVELEPWQCFGIGAVYGWRRLDPEAGWYGDSARCSRRSRRRTASRSRPAGSGSTRRSSAARWASPRSTRPPRSATRRSSCGRGRHDGREVRPPDADHPPRPGPDRPGDRLVVQAARQGHRSRGTGSTPRP